MKMAREALTGYTQAETLGNIVSEAFRRNDASATELFDSLPEGQAKENAFRTLMHELAQNDPMKALELLETQGSEPSTRYSKNWLLGEIVKKDFEGGLAMLHSEQWLPKIFGNEDTWSFSGEGGLISQLMKTDAALVRAHIEQMPEQYKAQALSAYILRLASDNAAVAAQELTNLPDSQQTRDVTQNVLRQWSEFQPRQAMQWVCEQYPDSEDKTAAMHYKDVLRQWVKVEPEAASQWLAEQPAGLARDSMVVGLIDSEKYGEPEVSMQWAQSITDKNRREGSIAGIFSVWRTFDPQAATQALETSGLGPERIKELIQQPLLRHETHNNYRTYYFH